MNARLHKARRNLRALLILGLLLTVLGTGSAALLLSLHFTRLPSATMSAWRFWKLILFHDIAFLLIFVGVFFATRPLLAKPPTNDLPGNP